MNAELNGLAEATYDELRYLARSYFRRERGNHTLQPTALVHEVYLRMARQNRTQWQSRTQLLGIAALMMRRVLREYARGRGASRRGGDAKKLILEDSHAVTGGPVIEFLAVDETLNGLAALDPDAAKVVELRFFGGLSIEETATELRLSPATIKRHWTVAKAYLNQQLRAPQTADRTSPQDS